MKILITGGSGFIGTHLRKRLWEHGFETINFDLIDDGKGDFYYGDVRNIDSVLGAPKVDKIYHLASLIDATEESKKKEYFETNVIGTMNVSKLDAEIIFTSSAAIHGNTTYGRTKKIAEEILWFNNNHKIARLYNVVGPESNGVINKFVRAALKNEPLIINGGDQYRDFIYIDDVIDQLICMDSSRSIGTGIPIRIESLAYSIKSITKSKSKITFKRRDDNDMKSSFSKPERFEFIRITDIINNIIKHEQGSIN